MRFRSAVLSFFVGLLSLALLDVLLALAGLVVNADAALWGTFGDWAQGILPAGALLGGMYMWIDDNRSAERAVRDMMGNAVYMHADAGRSLLVNGGTHQIYVLVSGVRTCIPPQASKPFGLVHTTARFETAVGESWIAALDAPSQRV